MNVQPYQNKLQLSYKARYLQQNAKFSTLISRGGKGMSDERKISFVMLGIFICAFFLNAYEEKIASKGEVTEALFILQNKHAELLRYLQNVKKKLTHCFAHEKTIQSRINLKTNLRDVYISYCKFYQQHYPIYVKELEHLSSRLLEYIADISQNECSRQETVKAAVREAFLIKDKLDLEASIIDLIKLMNKQPDIKVQQLKPRDILKIKQMRTSYKKKLRTKKEAVAKINKQLYRDHPEQQCKTFLAEIMNYCC